MQPRIAKVWKPVAGDKTWGSIQSGDGLYRIGYTLTFDDIKSNKDRHMIERTVIM